MASSLPGLLNDLQICIAGVGGEYPNVVRGEIGIASAYVDEIAVRLDRARQRMAESLPGAKTTSWDASGGSGTILDDHGVPMPTISDPTGEAGIRADSVTGDRVRLAKALATARDHARLIVGGTAKDLVDSARVCRDETRQAWIIVDRWARTSPTSVDRHATEPPPGCESCARDGGHWEPVSRVVRLVDGGGRMPMCSWCRDRYGRWGSLPTMAELRRNHQGRNVPDRTPR